MYSSSKLHNFHSPTFQSSLKSRTTSPTRLWATVRNGLTIPKAGDLLWRLLHDKVPTGHQLHWIPLDQQVCPLHGCSLTKTHIFIECETATAVMQEMDEVWAYLGSKVPAIWPTDMDGVTALMGPGLG
jgi:hypothetical protein